jgi:transcriptional coactivator p15 (PC4)
MTTNHAGNRKSVTTHEWKRAKRETVRLSIGEFKGKPYVELRTWWLDRHGEYQPGPRGVRLPIQELLVLPTAMKVAKRRARKLRLLPKAQSRKRRK